MIFKRLKNIYFLKVRNWYTNGQTIKSDQTTTTPNLGGNQTRKPNYNLCSNWPRMGKTWPVTAKVQFSVLPLSSSGPTRELCSPNQSHKMPPFLIASPMGTTSNQKADMNPSFPLELLHSPPAFEFPRNTRDGSWLPRCSKLWINSLCVFSFGWSLVSSKMIATRMKNRKHTFRMNHWS